MKANNKKFFTNIANYYKEEIHDRKVNNTQIKQSNINSNYHYFTKAVGVTYSDNGISRQNVIATLKAGDVLLLEKEPTNKYDKNAIRILTTDKNMIGYISKNANVKLIGHLSDNTFARATVSSVTGSKTTNYGVNIKIELNQVNKPKRKTSRMYHDYSDYDRYDDSLDDLKFQAWCDAQDAFDLNDYNEPDYDDYSEEYDIDYLDAMADYNNDF